MFAAVRLGEPKAGDGDYTVVELPEVKIHVHNDLVPKEGTDTIRLVMDKFLWQMKIEVEGFDFKVKGAAKL